ncbi:MAG: hypothetical protein ACI92S_000422, partial [Planctomycetaceae bacterium]
QSCGAATLDVATSQRDGRNASNQPPATSMPESIHLI